jgi:hypothetical protein
VQSRVTLGLSYFFITSARPSKQPLMVRTFLKKMMRYMDDDDDLLIVLAETKK